MQLVLQMQNKKCLLLYRLTCSIFVLFKGFSLIAALHQERGKSLYLSALLYYGVEEGERGREIRTVKCKNTPQLFGKGWGVGVWLLFSLLSYCQQLVLELTKCPGTRLMSPINHLHCQKQAMHKHFQFITTWRKTL